MLIPSLIIATALFMPQDAHAAWSFGKIGSLGGGNGGSQSSASSILNPPAREDDWKVFGPRPKYIGPEGFGYIPTLSDLLGD